MAELVAAYPNRYIAAIANVPLNDMDATLKETERAVKELGFKGIQIYSRVNGKPPSTDEMMPLYELMCEVDLPIWIHPMRSSEPARLRNGDRLLQPALLHIRLALRHDRGHGSPRLCRHLREIPQHQVHHPPLRRHGPLFLRPAHHPLQQRPRTARYADSSRA